MPDVNLNEGVNAVANQRVLNQKFLTNQNLLTSDFLNKFTGTITGQGTTEAAAQRIGEEQNLPTLRKNAFAAQQALYDIPETYRKSALGMDVNANQLARIINQKTSELGPIAARLTEAAQFGEAEVGRRLGYLQNDWNRQLLPLTSEQSFLTDRLARETSLYTQDNQRELDAILAKMNAGITLSEGEKNRASQLAIAEKGYENALKVAQQKTTSPFGTLGEGSSIYDTQTGKIIGTAPKSYAPSQQKSTPTPTFKNTPSPTYKSNPPPPWFTPFK